MAAVFERLHDVRIQGNTKTKDSVIEAEMGALRDATTFEELFQAAAYVESRLHSLQIFDSVHIKLSHGPPGTANVVVEVSELRNRLRGTVNVFNKKSERSSSLEGSVKMKNLFGYGDLWDGSMSCGWDQSKMSMGFSLPRWLGCPTPMAARVYLLSQDWLKLSSFKEQSLGASIELLSTRNHGLSYNAAWRTLMDPSEMASASIRRQLGHTLLSSLKYSYKVDCRDSSVRPTSGYCFASTTQVSGLTPDSRGLRFLRQDFDARFALPLGFSGAALNFGISSGLLFPWGSGLLDKPSSVPDRYFMGGNSSAVRTLGGFKFGGLGPTDLRRRVTKDDTSAMPMDVLGGDLGVTAFADLSFDLPFQRLKEAGIHGHVFASAGTLTQLSDNNFRNFSLRNFYHSFKTTLGFGIVVPTKLFTMEANLCYTPKQNGHDSGKTGLEFSFSAS